MTYLKAAAVLAMLGGLALFAVKVAVEVVRLCLRDSATVWPMAAVLSLSGVAVLLLARAGEREP